MDLSSTLEAWNGLGGTNSAKNQNLFSADSSGNVGSGLNMSLLSKGLKAGGSVIGAYGYLMEGDQIAGAYDYNANLALIQGDFTNDALDAEAPVLAGEQRALYARAGVTMSGSPLDVMLESASDIELDKQINAFNTHSRVEMLRYEGEVAKNQAKFKAGQTLLSGAMSFL